MEVQKENIVDNLSTTERLRKKDYIVRPISPKTTIEFIKRYHYARSASKASVYRLGLFHKTKQSFEFQALGVALWLPPMRNAALWVNPDEPERVLCISRLAIKDDVPKNAASFFLGRCREYIKKIGRYTDLLAYADTFRMHTGHIYKADNWTYRGLSEPLPVWIRLSDFATMGFKRADESISFADMRNKGFEYQGKYPKHRYTYKLD